ncbi:MAG TPA: HDIG domain-containing protein [Candidatus Limnocylindrales bacterium]|nr:HDIG domain-containing protein [Candidatus Limnocylindrales bacterium]
MTVPQQRPPRFPGRRELLRILAAAASLIVVMTVTLGLDLSPGLDVKVNSLAPSDIRAPRAITFTNDALTEQARKAAADAVPPQYDFTTERAITIANEQLGAFAKRVALLDTAFSPDTSAEERQGILDTVVPSLSDDGGAVLQTLKPERWAPIRSEAARVLDLTERNELRDTEVAQARASLSGQMAGDLSQGERTLAADLVGPLLVPNSSFSQERTDQEKEKQAAAVAPVVESIAQGEVLVFNGTKITPEILARIQALGLDERKLDVASIGGWLLLSGLLVSLLIAWLRLFRPEYWHRNNVVMLIWLLIAFATFALQLTQGRPALPFILPVAAIGLIVTVLLDAETAILVTAAVALVAGAVNGPSLELGSYVMLGGLAGIIAIRRGDKLQAFLQAGAAIFVVQAVVVTAFSLLGERDLTGVLQLMGAAAASAGGAAVAAVGSFAVLGNVFGLLTVFQLLELANPSQPLLRRLLVETPGTYHHSLMVGNLAERAAEAIGADPLITRVAAYYHDVGKLANPIAFIENQSGGDNVHDLLPPDESATILKQHVADGIDVAYQARLPKTLIAFIPQHHGTAVMGYFLGKAREEAAAPYGGIETEEGKRAAEAVDVRRYRHAGPKPQSREAALLMLADGVEASVRSLSSRDEASIRAMVGRIIADRLADGQFDECDLTLRDINVAQEAFVQQLLGMYHQRVAYPSSKVVEIESRRAAGGGGGTSA